jgi:dTDP-4-amino-4,6-dideoxygalactose transaminase
MAIPVTKPSIRRRDMDAVLTCMVSDSLGPGSISRDLSSQLAKYLDLPGGIALREYRRAVETACGLLGIGEGTRVLLSPLLPSVYFDVLHRRGATMVFADVEESGVCLSMESIGAIGEVDCDRAIVDTTLGYSPDLRGLRERGAAIIEDISQGIGGHNGHERNGSLGDCVIVGLEPDDIITAGGGTVVLSGSRKTQTALKSAAAELGRDVFLPDMNSALGLTQIKELENFVARRQEIAHVFARAMMRSNHRTPVQPGDGENVHYSFPVILRSGMKDVMAYARKNGVETVPAFSGSILAQHGEIIRQENGPAALPNASSLLMRCLLFPLYPTLTKKDRDLISRVLSTLP